MSVYFRPLLQCGWPRPDSAKVLAGGWCWFAHAERLERGAASRLVDAGDIPDDWIKRLTAERPPLAGLALDRPRIMGILNVTPDSFSDGGAHASVEAALAHARTLVGDGADIIDVGGESTRPGAVEVPIETEIARTEPVIAALRAAGIDAPISIDTRKANVARAVQADLINDVSGFCFDEALAGFAVEAQVPVCVMHSSGDPSTMQNDPRYDDVLLDVFDWLEARISALEAQGIPRGRILADPGIGFGKTFDHNMALIERIALFHGLGTPLLLGVSRKGFIGHIGQAPEAAKRAPGSIAVALHAIGAGVQMIRAHDVAEHAQALALWRACMASERA